MFRIKYKKTSSTNDKIKTHKIVLGTLIRSNSSVVCTNERCDS